MQKKNNQAHIYGFINDIRLNEMADGKTAVNLDVVTLEQFKRDGKTETRRSYHDVAVFTSDPDRFAALVDDIEKNKANRGVEGYKPVTHTVSLDGILVNRQNSIPGTDKTYRTLQIVATDDKVKLDVKQEENEVRNSTVISGNIANIRKEENFAVLSVIHHYRPEGSEKDYETSVDIRVSGDRRFSKPFFEAITKDELKVGDFIRVSGQLHNNNFEKDEKKYFSVSLDANSFEKITRKQAEEVAEKPAEKKEAKKEEKKPAKKAAEKKETKKETKKEAKKAVKKSAMKM